MLVPAARFGAAAALFLILAGAGPKGCTLLPPDEEPLECSTDADCPTGQICGLTEECAPCDAPPGAACDAVCVQVGQCVTPPETCQSDDECGPGERCVIDYECPPCVDEEPACLAPCQAVGHCEAGPTECYDHDDCGNGEYCDFRGTPTPLPEPGYEEREDGCEPPPLGQCQPLPEQCYSDEECPEDFYCSFDPEASGPDRCIGAGQCVRREPEPVGCTWDGDCPNGYCELGVAPWDCEEGYDCEGRGLGQCVYPKCDDGSPALCDMMPPLCPPGQTAAVRNGCWECVDARTCGEVGGACTSDADCPNGYCSYPDPDEGVIVELGQCVYPDCDDDSQAVCEMIPPVCPPGQTAAVRNGCWECVDARTCGQTSEGCATDADCGPGEQCFLETVCWDCLPEDPNCTPGCGQHGICLPADECYGAFVDQTGTCRAPDDGILPDHCCFTPPPSCPDESSPSVEYLSHDPLTCAAADWTCDAGWEVFDNECGCGCIRTR
ncbi:MAG: hypothetical protein D6729_05325 [Deltaproteobacteria bacterium]|nr:MAG: hypothetical protein D6729_05325 [Deltaproteobacteria bacterium]